LFCSNPHFCESGQSSLYIGNEIQIEHGNVDNVCPESWYWWERLTSTITIFALKMITIVTRKRKGMNSNT
jgi:hypothetical protein